MIFKPPQQVLEPSHGNQIQSRSTMVRSRGDDIRMRSRAEYECFGQRDEALSGAYFQSVCSLPFWVLQERRAYQRSDGLIGYKEAVINWQPLCTGGQVLTLFLCEAHAWSKELAKRKAALVLHMCFLNSSSSSSLSLSSSLSFYKSQFIFHLPSLF